MKWYPNIRIWKVEIKDAEDDETLSELFFLSEKRARKYIKKYEKNWDGCKVVYGGEILWLW